MKKLLLCRVDGESMHGAGLNDGDLIVIDRSEEPKMDLSQYVF